MLPSRRGGRGRARAWEGGVNNEWNIGQVLFGMEVTLAGVVFALAGSPPLAIIAAVIGLLICFSGLVARPRTGP